MIVANSHINTNTEKKMVESVGFSDVQRGADLLGCIGHMLRAQLVMVRHTTQYDACPIVDKAKVGT